MKKLLSMFLLSSSLVFANNNTIGLDTIVGATIGVAIGNQIGKGTGRDVAKVAGGLLGAAIANNSRDTRGYSNYDNSYNNSYERSRTYVRSDYYSRPSEVVVIVNDFAPRHYSRIHHPRPTWRHHKHHRPHSYNYKKHGHRR